MGASGWLFSTRQVVAQGPLGESDLVGGPNTATVTF